MKEPQVVVFPSTSLMDIREVECPGCGSVHVYTPTSGTAARTHENHCPVQGRIEAAIRQHERETVRHG